MKALQKLFTCCLLHLWRHIIFFFPFFPLVALRSSSNIYYTIMLQQQKISPMLYCCSMDWGSRRLLLSLSLGIIKRRRKNMNRLFVRTFACCFAHVIMKCLLLHRRLYFAATQFSVIPRTNYGEKRRRECQSRDLQSDLSFINK